MIILHIELPRMFVWKSHAGFGRRSFNPMQRERDYVQYQLRQQYSGCPVACPLRVSYDFYFVPPQATSKKKREEMLQGKIKHTKKVDVTNMQKFFEDTLKGVVIEDDAYVYRSEGEKHYGTRFSVTIKIYPHED